MKKAILASLMFIGFTLFPSSVSAQSAVISTATNFAATCQSGSVYLLGLKTWDACLNHSSGGAPEITSLPDIWLIVLVLIEDAIILAGYIAAGFIIWGGISFIKSQGDPKQISDSKQVIFNAVIGLIIALISVAIVNFIAGAF